MFTSNNPLWGERRVKSICFWHVFAVSDDLKNCYVIGRATKSVQTLAAMLQSSGKVLVTVHLKTNFKISS